MDKKLYQFLLLDPQMLTEENGFVEYKHNVFLSTNTQYKSLVMKFFESLCIMKFYIEESKGIIKYWDQVLKDIDIKIENVDKQIKELKKDAQLGDYLSKAYVKKQVKKGEERDVQIASILEHREEDVKNVKKLNCLGLEKFILESLRREGGDERAVCKRNITKLKLLEQIFYDSFAFRSRYEKVEDKWEWICPEQKLIDDINNIFLYWFAAPGKEPNDEEDEYEVVDKEEVEKDERVIKGKIEEDVSERIFGKLGFKDIGINNNWIYYLDFALDNFETIKATYSTQAKVTYMRKKAHIEFEDDVLNKIDGKETLEVIFSNKVAVEQLCECIEQYGGMEEFVPLLYEKDFGVMKDAIRDLVESIHKRLVFEKEILNSTNSIGNTDYERILKIEKQMRQGIEDYDRYGKYIKDINKRLKINFQMTWEEAERAQERSMLSILESVTKCNNENKRNSINRTLNRLSKVQKFKDHNQGIYPDVDVILLKAMMRHLKKNVEISYKNEKLVISSFVEEKGVYPIYTYKSVGILLLNFPNSRLKKYKTAAVIVNKEDIEKMCIKSDKVAWTFKGGSEYSRNEYSTKTYRADVITASGKKINIFERLTGTSKPVVTLSHKFDLRKSQLQEIEIENVKNNENEDGKGSSLKEKKQAKKVLQKKREELEENYYEGCMRIDLDSNGNPDLSGVCINGVNNEKGAPILYFDDKDAFQAFLESLA